MKLRIALYLLLLATLCMGCGGSLSMHELERLEARVNDAPDSVLAALTATDIPRWGKARALYALLTVQAQDKSSMDEYGHLSMITSESYPEIVINTNTIWSEDDYIYNNVRIVNGRKLTISANIKKYFTSSITIENGGELIVDNGSVARGNVVVRDGGHLSLINNGKIQLDNADNLRVELGEYSNCCLEKLKL